MELHKGFAAVSEIPFRSLDDPTGKTISASVISMRYHKALSELKQRQNLITGYAFTLIKNYRTHMRYLMTYAYIMTLPKSRLHSIMRTSATAIGS